jgi:hypothetical protein
MAYSNALQWERVEQVNDLKEDTVKCSRLGEGM